MHIDRIASSAATASGAAAGKGNYDFKSLFPTLDKSLPYRVTDKPEGGNPGDLVNFVIVGSQEQVTECAEGMRAGFRLTKPILTRLSVRCWRPCRRIPT